MHSGHHHHYQHHQHQPQYQQLPQQSYGAQPPPRPPTNSYGSYLPPSPSRPPPQNDLRGIFNAADRNGSGSLSPKELQQALINGDWTQFDTDTVKMLMNMFDRNRSGGIDFNEFTALWKYISEWQGAFQKFDTDRSGTISERELGNALQTFGFNLSPRLVHILELKYGGFIGPGGQAVKGITFDHFVRCCVTVRYLRDAFKQRDPQRLYSVTLTYEWVDRTPFRS